MRAMLGSFGCRDNFEGAQVPNTARWTRRRPCRSRAEPATWIWTAALVCVASSRVLARADEGLLSITVAVPMSDRVGVTEDARRLYVESDELHLDVSVVNQSDSRITIDQEQLQRAFRVTLTTGGTSIPVVATWSDDALVIAPDSDTRDSVSRPDPLNVEGHGGAYWTVTVRRSDSLSFGSGRYRLTWSSADLAAAIHGAEGGQWNGRAPDKTSSVGLLIQPPQSVLEAARMSTTEADDAVLRGHHQHALAAYQRALSADPSDSRTKTMMAFMYLRLNRYQEAIRPLEDVLAGAVGEKNLSFVLALAYVGAGDEGNAVRVLRWTAGLPEDRVRTEVETLGREVRRRGPRR